MDSATRAYFKQREATELAAANVAENTKSRAAHLELALRYGMLLASPRDCSVLTWGGGQRSIGAIPQDAPKGEPEQLPCSR